MKKGDKVVLKSFKGNKNRHWFDSFDELIGRTVSVFMVDDSNGTFGFYLDEKEVGTTWLQSACETVKNERYFLVSYSTGSQTGNIWLKSDKMPSNKFLKEDARKNHGVNAVITNIFEFKSEQDFLDFTSNE